MDDDLHTRSLLLIERWNRLGQQQKLGALSLEDIDIAQNRIVEQLIQISKELERSDQVWKFLTAWSLGSSSYEFKDYDRRALMSTLPS